MSAGSRRSEVTPFSSRATPSVRDAGMVGVLVEDARSTLRLATEENSPVARETVLAPPTLQPVADDVVAILAHLPALVRFLHRGTRRTMGLVDDRGLAVSDTVRRISVAHDAALAALGVAAGALGEARDESAHLTRADTADGEAERTTGAAEPGRTPREGLETIPAGPFEDEPFELLRRLTHRSDGSEREEAEIGVVASAWLAAVLGHVGVALGTHDRLVTSVVASDGIPTVQTIAGWVTRAHAVES